MRGFVRDDQRVGCRSHVLVLPSVVCATRVAQDIAAATGGVAIVHQHGCSQVGDDEEQTAAAFELVACSPNVGAVLVVSLGCETVQGREVARRIAERGQRVEFVGIQDSGGSDAAVAGGHALARGLAEELAGRTRTPVAPSRLVVGIETSRESEAAVTIARRLSDRGASLVLGSDAGLPRDILDRARTVRAFGEAPGDADGSHLVLEGAGAAAEQHTALVAAGAQLVISFPGLDDAPVGFPVCPVIAVGGPSPLHVALTDEFDAAEPVTADTIWRRVTKVFSGAPSAAESFGKQTFALARLARSM